MTFASTPSRLLGRDTSLVLHGGGNTSVKVPEKNLFGEDEDILFVKGSGWDLETIEADGFLALPDTPHTFLRLRASWRSSPTRRWPTSCAMECMKNPSAPPPSKSRRSSARLVAPQVRPTIPIADAPHFPILNTPDGEEPHPRDLRATGIVVIPSATMPGLRALAAPVGGNYIRSRRTPPLRGMVLMNHGLFDCVRTERPANPTISMIELVTKAEDYLARKKAWNVDTKSVAAPVQALRQEIATLRRKLCTVAVGCTDGGDN